jgi:hypothetical protein
MLKSPQKSNDKTIAKHPSEVFILYLSLIKAPIDDTLRGLDLPIMPPGYLSTIKDKVELAPKEFDPTNKFHKESVSYLKEIGLYNFFYPDKYTKEAKKLLELPDVKHNIEQMLLVRNPPMRIMEIARRINAKFDMLVTEEGIDRFRHYFWNTSKMKMDDWNQLLNNIQE